MAGSFPLHEGGKKYRCGRGTLGMGIADSKLHDEGHSRPALGGTPSRTLDISAQKCLEIAVIRNLKRVTAVGSLD